LTKYFVASMVFGNSHRSTWLKDWLVLQDHDTLILGVPVSK